MKATSKVLFVVVSLYTSLPVREIFKDMRETKAYSRRFSFQ